ncbi:MAG: phage holin family protein [Burkholderiaceae bacterium]|nr:phage holin family protein [Burkholderiaceae bacterium]
MPKETRTVVSEILSTVLSISSFAKLVTQFISTRLQIASQELKTMPIHVASLIGYTVLLCLFATLSTISISFIFLVVFWDSYRILTIVTIAFFYLVITGWLLRKVRVISLKITHSMDLMRQTIENDISKLIGSDEDSTNMNNKNNPV